ncbi:MAG: radical SAM protein [Clostridia bacterium]
MNIGLYDVDSKNFPNLALMKISAYWKNQGANVEFMSHLKHYDKVYVSKIFGDEYSQLDETVISADEIIVGGTGFAISVKNGKEIYNKKLDNQLPKDIENCYPDYNLYPQLTKNKAYGFLTRGCPNNCSFCLVSEKESRCCHKVADLKNFWNGQKEIVLLDPNILACSSCNELLQQLVDSGSKIDFTQGLDARFITKEVCEYFKKMKVKMYHFAFDFLQNEEKIFKGLSTFKECMNYDETKSRNAYVYVLTNYNTTFEQEYYRVKLIQYLGFSPDIRIYRKATAPRITRDLQRWCNNKIIYRSCKNFLNYIPRTDGKTIREIYF